MKCLFAGLVLGATLAPLAARAQYSAAPEGGVPTKTTYVRLANNANAIIVEPATPNPAKGRIAVLVTHPEHLNNFNYFIGRGLTRYGYRVMLLNYYGPERTYYEFLAPIAAAIKALRAIPGVEKVVLAGHSTGGAELTAYQDVAENGPKACQGPERVYKCQTKDAQNLPKADGLMLLDANSGAPERTTGLNPAVDPHHPRQYNAALDLFDPKNGYDPATGSATYSAAFLSKFFAAQGARANQLIDEAQARLETIEKGEGDYQQDEPFIVAGTGLFTGGAKPEMAYIGLVSKSHAPHQLLKADGSNPVQIISLVKEPQLRSADKGPIAETPVMETVRNYLSFQALRLTPDYRMTADSVLGVQWRSTPNSVPGNVEGIHVPTLVMSATCAPHLVFLEIAYDRSVAKDKEFAGVEGADHGFLPCRPEYGDTFKRAFDFADSWLSKPGRF
jgi:pimeloyl-ACP methyl ester carboxylesterase